MSDKIEAMSGPSFQGVWSEAVEFSWLSNKEFIWHIAVCSPTPMSILICQPVYYKSNHSDANKNHD